MPFNPFIELFRRPIFVLSWLGYLLVMVGIVVLLVPWSVRKAAKLVNAYLRDRMSDDWWSFGDTRKGYIPPTDWLLSAFWVVFVLGIAAWALGTVVWLVGG